MTDVARDEAKARRLGITYGAMKAPIVTVRSYAGPLADLQCESKKPPRVCQYCGAVLKGRKRMYCDVICNNRAQDHKRWQKEKLARAAAQSEQK